MPDRAEQRQFRRYPIQLPFLHKEQASVPARTRVGWTRNLSDRGVCVELAERLQSRTLLWVRLRTDRGAIDAEARVAWVSEPRVVEGGVLHGVAFTQVVPDQLQDLGELILTKGRLRPAGVRLPFEVAVTCQARGEAGPPLQGRTRDVGRGGLLLRLPRILPLGTVLEVSLHTPTGPLTAQGTIIWGAPPEGRTPGALIRQGLQFTALDWPTALSLGLVLLEVASGA